MAFAGREKEDFGGSGEGFEEGFGPQGPYVGGGDDEVAGGFTRGEFAQAGVEGAEDSGGYGDVVGGGGGGDLDDGHCLVMVSRLGWGFCELD